MDIGHSRYHIFKDKPIKLALQYTRKKLQLKKLLKQLKWLPLEGWILFWLLIHSPLMQNNQEGYSDRCKMLHCLCVDSPTIHYLKNKP